MSFGGRVRVGEPAGAEAGVLIVFLAVCLNRALPEAAQVSQTRGDWRVSYSFNGNYVYTRRLVSE